MSIVNMDYKQAVEVDQKDGHSVQFLRAVPANANIDEMWDWKRVLQFYRDVRAKTQEIIGSLLAHKDSCHEHECHISLAFVRRAILEEFGRTVTLEFRRLYPHLWQAATDPNVTQEDVARIERLIFESESELLERRAAAADEVE
jgi:hypothetical protein